MARRKQTTRTGKRKLESFKAVIVLDDSDDEDSTPGDSTGLNSANSKSLDGQPPVKKQKRDNATTKEDMLSKLADLGKKKVEKVENMQNEHNKEMRELTKSFEDKACKMKKCLEKMGIDICSACYKEGNIQCEYCNQYVCSECCFITGPFDKVQLCSKDCAAYYQRF